MEKCIEMRESMPWLSIGYCHTRCDVIDPETMQSCLAAAKW